VVHQYNSRFAPIVYCSTHSNSQIISHWSILISCLCTDYTLVYCFKTEYEWLRNRLFVYLWLRTSFSEIHVPKAAYESERLEDLKLQWSMYNGRQSAHRVVRGKFYVHQWQYEPISIQYGFVVHDEIFVFVYVFDIIFR
jgi:hypothetical protein